MATPARSIRPLQSRTASSRAAPWLIAVVATASLIAAPGARAIPFSSDIAISGSLSFDEGTALVLGNASQAGTLTATAGGSATSATYANTSVAPGTNPLTAALTDIGDGFGFSGSAGASTVFDEFLGGIDLSLSLSNTSATESYKIALGLDFLHTVDADGDDAYIESGFSLISDTGLDIFSAIISDTLLGDQRNDDDLGTAGAAVSDSGLASPIMLELTPGAAINLGGAFTLEGFMLEPGTLAGSFDFDLSIAEVSRVSSPPVDVPLPGTALLLGAGLIGLAGSQRRGTR